VEITADQVILMAARIQLPGATRLERFAAYGHSQFSATPVQVAAWAPGPGSIDTGSIDTGGSGAGAPGGNDRP